MMNNHLSPCKILETCLKPIGPFDAELGVPLVKAGYYLIEASKEGVSFSNCHSLVDSVLKRIYKTYLDEHRFALTGLYGVKKRLVNELAEIITHLLETEFEDSLLQPMRKTLMASDTQEHMLLAVRAIANLPSVDPRLLEALLRLSQESPSDSSIQRTILMAVSRMSLPFHKKLAHILDIPIRQANKIDVLVELLGQEGNQDVLASWLTGVSYDDEAYAYFLGQVLGKSAVHNPEIMRFIVQQHSDVPPNFLIEWFDGLKAEAGKLREDEESKLSPQVLEVVLDMLQHESTADFARRVFRALEIQPGELPRKVLAKLRPGAILSLRMPELGSNEVVVRTRWEMTIDAICETLELAEALYSSLQPITPVLQRLREGMVTTAFYGAPELLEFALTWKYGHQWRDKFDSLDFSEQVLDRFEERVLKYRDRLSQAMEKAQSEGREEAVQFHIGEIARCDRILEERKKYAKDKTSSPYFAWEMLNFADSLWSQAVDEFAELYTESLSPSDDTDARVETCRHLVSQFVEMLNAEAEAIGFPNSPLGLRGAATFLRAATNPSLRAKVLKYVKKARATLAEWTDADEMITSLLEAASYGKDGSTPLMYSPHFKALESLVKLAEGNPSLSPQVRSLLVDALEEIEALESPLGADLKLAASLFTSLGRLGIDYPSAKRIAETPGLQALISFCVKRYRVPLHEIRVTDQEAARLMQDVLPLSVKSLEDILLDSQNPAEQVWAAESLGEMFNLEPGAIIALIKAMHFSKNEFVSMEAAKSLYKQIVESRTSFSTSELEAIGYGLKALVESRAPWIVLNPRAALSVAAAYGYAFDTLWEINTRLQNEGYFSRKKGRVTARLAVAPLLEVLGGWLGLLGLGRLLAGKFASGLILFVTWSVFDALLGLWVYGVLRNRWFLCGAPLAGAVWFVVPIVSAFYLRKAVDLDRRCLEPLRRLSRQRATTRV